MALMETHHQLSVLVALDGSALSEAMLAPTVTLTEGLAMTTDFPGKIEFIRVVDVPISYGKFRTQVDAFYDTNVREELKKGDQEYLEAIARRFSEGEWESLNFVVKTTVATNHDIAQAIIQAAEQSKVDFIAMATHGRGGMMHWALGSVAERVLQATTRPLFIFRPHVKAAPTPE
jgi:nucleotide-binding universal stress UspA family protein